MALIFKNNAAGTLAANIGPTDNQILLGAGQGALFPTFGAGDYAYATLVHATTGAIEVVKITTRTVDTLSVTRGVEGAATAFTTGSIVEMRVTAGMLGELDQRSKWGAANGLATLDAGGLIPVGQIPAAIARTAALDNYILLTQKGAANGVATLDGAGTIPDAQIPNIIARDIEVSQNYVPNTLKGAANGVATLGADTKVPAGQIPDLSGTYLTKNNPTATGNLSAAGSITAGAGLVANQNVTSSTAALVLAPASAGTIYLRPNGAGSVANEATVGSDGVIVCVNTRATSDMRLKKNRVRHKVIPHLADQIHLWDWDWKAGTGTGQGVVAQHVQKYAPHHVSGDEHLSVDKAGLALDAIVDLAARLRKLEKAQHARR